MIAYAKNNTTVRDTAVMTVEPSPPVRFDLDTLTANIAGVDIVKSATIPAYLPLFALDTAYNRVTNMSLADGGLFLDDITINNTAIPAIRIDLSVRSWVFGRSIGGLYLCWFGRRRCAHDRRAFLCRCICDIP